MALCGEESTTRSIAALAEIDPSISVWWGTQTECVSALARHIREGHLRLAESARDELSHLLPAWYQISPSNELRDRAEQILFTHPLRAADALQLAAALVWCDGHAAGMPFVSLDNRLREAAQREGFSVLPSLPRQAP